jgi:hypothetical protein
MQIMIIIFLCQFDKVAMLDRISWPNDILCLAHIVQKLWAKPEQNLIWMDG